MIETPTGKKFYTDYEKGYQQGRVEVIEKIIEHFKPCNDCGICLEDDMDYFAKNCEADTQITYSELVEYLKQLKESEDKND